MDIEQTKSFIEELTAASAELLGTLFGKQSLDVERKTDDTPVTYADRETERLLRELISKKFPEHGILGEELPNINEDAEYVWVLDPIDGTQSFISNVPLFTTLIGLLHHGEPILGAIHQPILNQLVVGDNTSCTLNGAPVQVREPASLEEAAIMISDFRFPAQYHDPRGWDELASRARLVRTWGDGYGYLLLASSWVDAMCDAVLEPWDLAPIIPIVRGAGAIITDWNGGPIVKDKTFARSAVAAHPKLHEAIIDTLASPNRP